MINLMYILTIPLLRALIYYNHSFYLDTALKLHAKWLNGKKEKSTDKEKEISQTAQKWIQANILEIKRRVTNIGVTEPKTTIMKPAGLNYATPTDYSALDNLLFLNTEMLGLAREAIARAEGAYRTQAKLSFSPLYWIEMIIFFPREIIKMSGFKDITKKFQPIVNLVQLAYWIIMIIYTIKLITKNP